MEKLISDDLLKELGDISKRAKRFFKDASKAISSMSYTEPFDRPPFRDAFWKNLPHSLQLVATALVARIIRIAPLIAESSKMTPYLTQADQIELGHSIKGMRSALRLCRYSYWEPDVLHDEGTVLGIKPAGQSDDEGIPPHTAERVFEDCVKQIVSIVELVNPLTVGRVEQNIELKTQQSLGFLPDTAFIMMWMDPARYELEDTYQTVKRCFKEFNIEADRADDIEHEGLITEKIIDQIKSSEFLFADLSGARPSVYYEVGFAHAIRKRVILYRKLGEKLHFDLAGYNCPEYKNLSDLESKLRKRLSHMTGRQLGKQAAEVKSKKGKG